MADRTFVQNNYSLLKGLVRLYPIVKMTAATTTPVLQKRTFTQGGSTSLTSSSSLAAAPTTGVDYAVGDGAGTRSIARTGTGAWTLTLSDAYLYLVSFNIAKFESANGISTVLAAGIVSATTLVTTNTARGNGGVITLQLVDESGAADPGTIGDIFTFEIVLAIAGEP